MSINIEDLSVSYGHHIVFENLSLALSHNEFVGIIGPNGSGKSTLLKCLYRVLKADKGMIELDGVLLEKMTYKQSAQKMAVVAQHHHYQFDFSVEDIVMMGRIPHQTLLEQQTKKDLHLVEEALKRVSLSGMEKRLFSTLSGGEQQRVLLARAFVQETNYLILDEPTNHLDIQHQIGLLQMVKDAKLTTFAALHDLNLAAKFCDMLYVLNDTAIVAYGSPREVLTPQLIRQVYGVETEIIEDSRGQMHILFLS